MKSLYKIFFIIFAFIITQPIQAEIKDSIYFGKYHVRDTYNKVEVGDFTSDSIDFNPKNTATDALLRIFYTKNAPNGLEGQYAISINLKNFKGKGTYILGSSMGRWRASKSALAGIGSGQSGKITIESYNADSNIVTGTFSFSCTANVNGTEQTWDISKGKFRIGRSMVLKDNNKNPIANREIVLYKGKGLMDTTGLFGDSITSIKTDNDGMFYFKKIKGLNPGDPFYFNIYADTVKAIKPNHHDVDDIMYQVTLDNMKIDKAGKIVFDTLKNSVSTDTIIMKHTTLLLNLIVSVEWDAKKEYLNTLQRWFWDMSNYYYNLTNGQLKINKIAIYDNKVNFENADLQIFADNTVWSAAYPNGINNPDKNIGILSARIWYGSPYWASNYTWQDDWYTTTKYGKTINARTFAHELGHYFFNFYDEYWDENRNYVFENYNFGLMDTQYENENEYKDELSNLARYPNTSYTVTAQFFHNNCDCWTFFKFLYGKVRNGLPCPILMPSEMELPAGKDYMPGPNINLESPERNVGKTLEFVVKDVDNNSGDYLLDLAASVASVISSPKTDINVIALRFGANSKLSKINQGKTSITGKIRILGAKIDDIIRFSGKYIDEKNEFHYISGSKVIDKLSLTEKGDINVPMIGFNKNDIMSNVDSRYSLVPVWKYNSQKGFSLSIFSNMKYSQSPTIDMDLPNGTTKTYDLNYDINKKIYNVDINDQLQNTGSNFLNLFDDSKSSFFTTINHRLTDNYSSQISNINNSAFIYIDSLNSNINNFAFFNTNYLTLKNGLDSNAVQASDMHSFVSNPDLKPSTKNFITINYITEELPVSREFSLRVFKWDENKFKWLLIGGSVDTTNKQVTTSINSNGTYCLFTVNQFVGIDEFNDLNKNINIYPNPANNEFNISLNLIQDNFIKISIYDITGNLIKTADFGYNNIGDHLFNINTKELKSGSYFCKFYIGKNIITKNLEIIK
jgi:hypothetical protein